MTIKLDQVGEFGAVAFPLKLLKFVIMWTAAVFALYFSLSAKMS